MKCIHPVQKSKLLKGNAVLYSHRCGQCMPCRITIKQEKTLRIILEAKTHEYNSFVTLTYSDQLTVDPSGKTIYLYRKANKSLDKVILQKFIKRLRKNSKIKFRYFAVGEYGDTSGREHYHLILFGYPYFFDEYVEKSWTYGFTHVGNLENGGAQYVAGYTTKKLTKGNDALNGREPEFSLQSRRPGIGAPYCKYVVKNMIRDKLNFVGEDYKYMRVNGMMLPVDLYLQQQINKELGFIPIEKSFTEQLWISANEYKNMKYPEAENDLKARSLRKAKQKILLQKAKRKL